METNDMTQLEKINRKLYNSMKAFQIAAEESGSLVFLPTTRQIRRSSWTSRREAFRRGGSSSPASLAMRWWRGGSSRQTLSRNICASTRRC